MNIYLSSATLQSYENKNKSMDLFYNPIVIFEDIEPFMIEQCQVQTKNAPICSAKVHHLVTPIC
jgi:hypothetical protein